MMDLSTEALGALAAVAYSMVVLALCGMVYSLARRVDDLEDRLSVDETATTKATKQQHASVGAIEIYRDGAGTAKPPRTKADPNGWGRDFDPRKYPLGPQENP